jgi:hypothetical protein
MRNSFDLEIEDKFGEIKQYEVIYELSKYFPGDYFTPPEGGDIEIVSILESGKEVELDEKTLNYIYECATKHNKDYGYECYDDDDEED